MTPSRLAMLGVVAFTASCGHSVSGVWHVEPSFDSVAEELCAARVGSGSHDADRVIQTCVNMLRASGLSVSDVACHLSSSASTCAQFNGGMSVAGTRGSSMPDSPGAFARHGGRALPQPDRLVLLPSLADEERADPEGVPDELGSGSHAGGTSEASSVAQTQGTGDGQGVMDEGEPVVIGTIDRSGLHDVVQGNRAQLHQCYQQELTRLPSLSGKIVVRFVIAADGSVSSVSVTQSSMGNSVVESCLTETFRLLQFPEPEGGGIVVVSYPLIFPR